MARGAKSTRAGNELDPFDDEGFSLAARRMMRNTEERKAPTRRKLSGSAPPKRYASARGKSSIRDSVPSQQRCSVRVSYVGNGAPGHWRQHGIYLERDGAQREGEKGQGFNAGPDPVAIGRKLDGWQKQGDERIFKVILSPEFGSKVNLRDFTRDFLRQLEEDLETRLDWVAIDHHNTDYPHVHLCIRGVDDEGNPLAIHPTYIKQGMRLRAQEWLTRELGYRTEQDQQKSRDREVNEQRFTGLDRELVKKARSHPEQEIVFSDNPNPKTYLRERHLRQRLKVLEEMGLATRSGLLGDECWRLAESFEESIKRLSRAKDKQKALARHQAFVLDKKARLRAHKLKDEQRLVGRVLGTGLDEASDRLYILVEGSDGAIHHVMHDYRKGGPDVLKPGDIVLLEGLPDSNGQSGLAAEVLEDIPEEVLDALIRERLRKADDLEEVLDDMDTFSNKVKRKMLDRRAELTRQGLFTQMRDRARVVRTRRKARAAAGDKAATEHHLHEQEEHEHMVEEHGGAELG